MSRVKPCFASKPRAFITFQTSRLNTGKVRLDTLITGLSCARTGMAVLAARAAAEAVKARRVIVVMKASPWWRAARRCRLIGPCRAAKRHPPKRQGGIRSRRAAGSDRALYLNSFACKHSSQPAGADDAAHHDAGRDTVVCRGGWAGHARHLRPRIRRRLPHLRAADAVLLAHATLRHLFAARLSALRRADRSKALRSGPRP